MQKVQGTARVLNSDAVSPIDTTALCALSAPNQNDYLAEKKTQDRSRRDRDARQTTVTGWISRAVTYGCRFIAIPLSFKLLGAAGYGLWLSTGSLIAWLMLTDGGVSAGLVNIIAEASGLGKRDLIRRFVSTGFFTFLAIASIISVFMVATSFLLGAQIGRLLGVSGAPALARQAPGLALVCGLGYSCMVCTRTFESVCRGLQKGYLCAGSQIAADLAGIIALLFASRHGCTLVGFAIIMTCPPIFANLGLGVYLFARFPYLRPSWRYIDGICLRGIMKFAGPLMVVQLGTAGMLYSTNLLIANRLGPAAVPTYSVPYSLFMVVAGLCYLIAQPYIPAYAEASHSGDWLWVRRAALRTSYLATGLMAIAALTLFLVARPLIGWWVSSAVLPSQSLLASLGLFFVAMVWAETAGVLLIGLGRVALKAVLQISVGVVFVIGAFYLLPQLGIIAVPLAGMGAYLIDVFISLPFAWSHIKRQERAAALGLAG